MVGAVHLNDEFSGQAYKVGNVSFYGMLAPEMHTEAFASQQ